MFLFFFSINHQYYVSGLGNVSHNMTWINIALWGGVTFHLIRQVYQHIISMIEAYWALRQQAGVFRKHVSNVHQID